MIGLDPTLPPTSDAAGEVGGQPSTSRQVGPVIGFGGTSDGLKALREGTMHASVARRPKELGRIAVENALRAADDREVEKTVKIPVKVPGKVVTAENVDVFSG